MEGVLTNLALVLLFVLIGGFFSASELALVSLRDSQVERMAAASTAWCARRPPACGLQPVPRRGPDRRHPRGLLLRRVRGLDALRPAGRGADRLGPVRGPRSDRGPRAGHGVHLLPVAGAGRAGAQAAGAATVGGGGAVRRARPRPRRRRMPPGHLAAVALHRRRRAAAGAGPERRRRRGLRGGAARHGQLARRPRGRGAAGALRRLRRGGPPALGGDGTANRGGVPARGHAARRRRPRRTGQAALALPRDRHDRR